MQNLTAMCQIIWGSLQCCKCLQCWKSAMQTPQCWKKHLACLCRPPSGVDANVYSEQTFQIQPFVQQEYPWYHQSCCSTFIPKRRRERVLNMTIYMPLLSCSSLVKQSPPRPVSYATTVTHWGIKNLWKQGHKGARQYLTTKNVYSVTE